MSPEALLRELDADAAISGAALAQRFGVSRAAIWKQVQRLRKLHVPIEGAAGSGYRLAHPVEQLDCERLSKGLPKSLRSCIRDIEVHWELDSTSAELARRGGEGARGLVCFAEHQSAGRGRRGRDWHSPLAGGVCLSLGWRFHSGMAALSGLSLVVGVAAVRALEASCGELPGLGLKWPNDLVAGGRKLGGVLIELVGELDGPCDAIIGIGVNWRLPSSAARLIDQASTDLATLAAALPSRNGLALALIVELAQALQRFAHEGLAPFLADFHRMDLLRGREVLIEGAGERVAGTALGVDAGGLLRVQTPGGERRVGSGEVSVRAHP